MKIEIELNRKSFLLGVILSTLVFCGYILLFSNTKTVNAGNTDTTSDCSCAFPDGKGGMWYRRVVDGTQARWVHLNPEDK